MKLKKVQKNLLRQIETSNTDQSRLSRDSGVSRKAINRICKGITANPKLTTIQALSDALGCDFQDLVC